jgi:hypothetical protein
MFTPRQIVIVNTAVFSNMENVLSNTVAALKTRFGRDPP